MSLPYISKILSLTIFVLLAVAALAMSVLTLGFWVDNGLVYGGF